MAVSDVVLNIAKLLISLVIMIIIGLICFLIIAYIVKWAGELIFGTGTVSAVGCLIAAAVLSAGMLIGGGVGSKN
jgi:hypothetical protein